MRLSNSVQNRLQPVHKLPLDASLRTIQYVTCDDETEPGSMITLTHVCS